jgi:hypothetical protein
MSIEWEDFRWSGWRANTQDRGVFAVRAISTLLKQPESRLGFDDSPVWQWEWQPPTVSGTAKTKEAAQAAALAASNAARPVEWVVEATGWYREWFCAVSFGCWMRVRRVEIRRTTTVEVANDQNDGWDWQVHKDGKQLTDGWCKTREEAQTAAELAASASEADK